MEKIWDKLNNYDLWGVMFPGIMCNITITIIYKWGCLGLPSIDFLNNFGSTVVFIFVSFFVGLILQEIGSVIQKVVFFHKGEPSETFLLNNSKILNEKEKSLLIDLVNKEYNENFNANKVDCRIVFNYINTYLSMKGLSEKCDKMQSLFGLSRGLFSSFFVNAIVIVFILVFFANSIIFINMIVCLCICLLSSIFLFRRTLRYAKIRVKTVCQTYYIFSTKINK